MEFTKPFGSACQQSAFSHRNQMQQMNFSRRNWFLTKILPFAKGFCKTCSHQSLGSYCIWFLHCFAGVNISDPVILLTSARENGWIYVDVIRFEASLIEGYLDSIASRSSDIMMSIYLYEFKRLYAC